jgi:hypothetical protein
MIINKTIGYVGGLWLRVLTEIHNLEDNAGRETSLHFVYGIFFTTFGRN